MFFIILQVAAVVYSITAYNDNVCAHSYKEKFIILDLLKIILSKDVKLFMELLEMN